MPIKTFADGDVLTAFDMNTYLMRQAVITCTTGTRPSGPVEGMLIYETDTDLIRVWTGTGWETMAGIMRTSIVDRQFGQYTITNTTYGISTSGGTYTDCAFSFTAPWTGKVLLSFAATLSNSSTTADTYVAPAVRTGSTIGSGTIVSAADDNAAVRNTGTGSPRFGADHLLTGLGPGLIYNVRLEHRVGSASTGTINSRSLILTPAN